MFAYDQYEVSLKGNFIVVTNLQIHQSPCADEILRI